MPVCTKKPPVYTKNSDREYGTSPSRPDDDENVEQLESGARNHEQIHGGDLRRVVAKEGEPSLREAGRLIMYFATADTSGPAHIRARRASPMDAKGQ
jgi:hypothetical protein